MNVSIKSKLYIGIGLLAGFVVLLWISGSIFINTLAENSGAIIQDNIRSVTYAQQMEQALSDIYTAQVTGNTEVNSYDQAVNRFDTILHKQEANITETGEEKLTDHLRKNYGTLLTRFQSVRNADAETISKQLSAAYQQLHQNLSQLTTMNVDAIHRKNNAAQKTASNVTIYMSTIGALCSILGIIMLIRFPSYIVNPIRELITRIKDIANHNYDQKLEFQTGDEYEELAVAFNQMATKLQEYENSNLDRLMSEKKRVETIINRMGDAVIGLDADNYILFANEKAVELIGKQKQQLIGQYAPDIASHNNVFHKIYKAFKTEAEQNAGYVKIGSENEYYYSIEVIPVHQDKDENMNHEAHLGNIITLKNVTKFHELDQAKTNFISVVSHELKTPISSINMSLRLLSDERVGNLNEEQKELVTNIGKDVTRMKRTTSDLLDLSKIESGNIQLNTEGVIPGDLLEYAYETMLMQANQKDLQIELRIEDALPKIQADSKKTVWVLVNLISNAIRYTDSGGTITLNAYRDENRDYIRFSVEDTGTGIADKDLEKIFEKYYQVDTTQKDRFGSGLGLSIAKEFIHAQGGEIWAESCLGEGSCFSFILPINNYGIA
ncbi:MAG: HAMP domain-containing protein [Balneolaceae bacterium]|nr:HAMP domain-containing protein [Balneolaceae bacterium]